MRAVLPGKTEVMYNGEDSTAWHFEPVGNEVKDELLIFEIQVVCRLIQNKNGGILCKHLCQEDALQFAAGECKDTGMAAL